MNTPVCVCVCVYAAHIEFGLKSTCPRVRGDSIHTNQNRPAVKRRRRKRNEVAASRHDE